MNTETIGYDSAKLREQCPIIQQSKWNALKNIGDDAYFRAFGLSASDPSELWRLALSRSEPLSDAEHYTQFRTTLGKPTLGETIQSLAPKAKDDDELAGWLSKLRASYSRPPITRVEYDQARKDSDQTTRLLIWNWIQDPPLRDNWATASLCFCSDRAMAKLIYFIRHNKWLPAELLNKEPERISKLYRSLGLIPAKPRAIKDVDFEGGKIHWIPFKKTVHKAA
jgi:hypothetical protein